MEEGSAFPAVIAKDLAPSLKLDPAEAFVAALTHTDILKF